VRAFSGAPSAGGFDGMLQNLRPRWGRRGQARLRYGRRRECPPSGSSSPPMRPLR